MSTRQHSTRRTVLRTIGSLGLAPVATAATAGAADNDEGNGDDGPSLPANGARSQSAAAGCGSADVDRYIGTVDRIVDGRHVVLLLESDGELVDQHVAPRSTLESVEEGDILSVIFKDGDLLVAQQLPKRPGRSASEPSPQERFDSLASDNPT
ncbi:hypothetical protein Htur_0500 [Haloterrigena turkmenica DSM 5511]|uniref:Uncharacterized protein n=1 Tax=Haloterrigena turkmenica (strain ATCC 51198 / DSM 5511 / JCM 9101 / NCIMB 13204 / VKM B-1734 / 4k) TaxID=543526 RepID=D2RVN4_HALTV|nr:hypothetical protein [Haloterrigena turkmenica]ADB59398.1 hypothetical protein Htur_0500 [Haloterrigena turkmenica DSM 5511]